MALFHSGERVRVSGSFDAPLEGATGRVNHVICVDIGDGALAYDVEVLLDEPVDVWGDGSPQRTFAHSEHNFEHIDEPPKSKGKGNATEISVQRQDTDGCGPKRRPQPRSTCGAR